MKVLIANKFFFRNGGSESVMFQEREFLRRSEHQVVDFSMEDERNIESAYASYFVSRHDYKTGSKLDTINSAVALVHSREAVRKFNELIDDTSPDLVHCHNIYHQITPSIIGAAKTRGIPVVLTLHDYKPVCPVYTRITHEKPCSACLDGDFSQVIRRRCADNSLGKSSLLYMEAIFQRRMGNYEKVDRFLAPSRFMQDSVLRRFSPSQVVALYNGVDVNEISASDRDEGYVLYLGRLSKEKGVETLLRAHAAAGDTWPLVVAGTGPLADTLRSNYGSARFIGHVSGDELKRTVENASLLVVPSEWYENCPMSVLEAMAYGKPVVGSRMGGIPELVADGETGLLFDAGNVDQLRERLETLMASPELRRSMGRRARVRAEQEFSLDKHNERLLSIYRSLINS